MIFVIQKIKHQNANEVCGFTFEILSQLHHVFPWHGRDQKLDPARPITSWRSAWRSILKAADVQCRPHDLRHSAVTVMAEAGLPDATIMAQVGHISPQMLKHYTHIRRQAMNQAAAALEPTWMTQQQQPTAELVN